jgi:hypothetical protein
MKFMIMLATAAAFAAGPSSAWSQSATNPSQPCPAASSTQTTGKGDTLAEDKAPAQSQGVEKSAILPDAGGHDASAAPTMAQKGSSNSGQTTADCSSQPTKPNG